MGEAVIETTSGKLRGEQGDGVVVFRGVPYGAPTGGAARFRPPAPRAPWAGIRDATDWAPAFPQPESVHAPEIVGNSIRIEPQSEDALVVNVWTPALDGAARPVMVWLHGGGFTSGSGSWPPYDGTALARHDDVVVVTVNHRLGLFGYLHLGELVGDEYADSGNAGMLDVVAALRWVRDNIAAFGGDAANVTIFGESGGGGKVNALLAMPDAAGLFHRAVCQSGVMARGTSIESATRTAVELLAELGLAPADATALLEVPTDKLLAAQITLGARSAAFMGGGRATSPVVGCPSLPVAPFEAVAAGSARGVPLVVGTNKDEVTIFLAADPQFGAYDDDGLRARLTPMLGDDAAAIEAAYRRTRPDASPTDLLVAILSDYTMRMPSIELARRHVDGGTPETFMYLFAFESSVLGGRLKANHGLEIRFVFDTLAGSSDASSRGAHELANQMRTAWATFARSGNPNHPGIPEWPAYATSQRATMWFDRDNRVVDDPFADERAIWDEVDFISRGLM